MSSDDKMMPLNEAVTLIMQRRGVSRRNARRMLVKHLAKGEISSEAELVERDGTSSGRHALPTEFWKKVTWPEEH